MASENHGLQIALIISVMTIVLLSVTTFMFFKSNEDAELQAHRNAENETKAKLVAKQAIAELIALKKKVGFADEDDAVVIDDLFLNDVQEYAGAANEADQTYRRMLENMHATLASVKGSLVEKIIALEEQKKLNEDREAAKESQITTLTARAVKAEEALQAAQTAHNTAQARVRQQNRGLNTNLEETRAEGDAKEAELNTTLVAANENTQRIARQRDALAKQVKAMLDESFDVADGEIRSVNQRTGTVWINIGRADHLQRLTTFAVYPAETNDLAHAVKKADIEVTLILGDHRAEAVITQDDPGNPVMLGDLLHSPVWSPGSQEHFALATGMDMDGDGKSDVARVRNLITMNGGVVDCWVDDAAMELKDGVITTETRYLVLGRVVDDSGPGELRDINRDMTREADRLGVQTITLSDLLNRMGSKNRTPVIRYGPDANSDDFRAKAPAGVPRVSTGTVTELFKSRTPPKPPRTAY